MQAALLLLTYSDLWLRLQACCMHKMTLCSVQEGRGEQGVQHKDTASRCLQQKPGSKRPECELQGSWVLSWNRLLLSVLSGLGRESMPLCNSDNCMHPMVQCIANLFRRHPCRSQPKVPFCGHAP